MNLAVYRCKIIPVFIQPKKSKIDEIIPLLNYPPYSPDMNLIEHVWKKLTEVIHQHYPELMNMGKTEADLRAFSGTIIEAWDSIPQAWIDNLIDSTPYGATNWSII